jgi:hypothetical protein
MRRLADPYQRRRAIVDLHAEGWSNTAISAYLQTPRHRVYEVLKRWALFGHKGLEDIPQWHARKAGTREIDEVVNFGIPWAEFVQLDERFSLSFSPFTFLLKRSQSQSKAFLHGKDELALAHLIVICQI